MITVNGLCADLMEVGVVKWGDECSVHGGDGEILFSDRRSCKD